MQHSTDISRPIIEALYSEALVLADEVRSAFDFSNLTAGELGRDGDYRLALSVEGLRTTTRIMHVLAWLLNQRAYLSGDMTAQQVRRHGTLPEDRPAEEELTRRLRPSMQAIIAETEYLHGRVARLDEAWREGFDSPALPIHRMHDRLRQEVGRA